MIEGISVTGAIEGRIHDVQIRIRVVYILDYWLKEVFKSQLKENKNLGKSFAVSTESTIFAEKLLSMGYKKQIKAKT